uniref:Uncharacterized protein n=1 Tax=Knipowitschia caucasica TaxID=637954 RepID=A0AAV2JT73_KNICA
MDVMVRGVIISCIPLSLLNPPPPTPPTPPTPPPPPPPTPTPPDAKLFLPHDILAPSISTQDQVTIVHPGVAEQRPISTRPRTQTQDPDPGPRPRTQTQDFTQI